MFRSGEINFDELNLGSEIFSASTIRMRSGLGKPGMSKIFMVGLKKVITYR